MLTVEIDSSLFSALRSKLTDENLELSNRIAAMALRSIQTNFDVGGRPPWAPLNPKYRFLKLRKGYPDQTLIRTGALKNSITAQATPGRVTLRTEIPYAPHHHFGTKTIPVRPFLTIPQDDIENIRAVITNYLSTHRF